MQEVYQGPEGAQQIRPLPGLGSLYSQMIQLGEGRSEQPGQGAGVKHPQSRLSWHQWSQDAGLPPSGLGWAWEVSKAAHGARSG